MKVHDCMTKEVITLFEDEVLSEVMLLFDPAVFRHLPIINRENDLVGIISTHDLSSLHKTMGFDEEQVLEKLKQRAIHEIMTTNLHTVSPECDVVEAANIMIKHKINALPVLEDGKLAGIITSTDLLQQFVAHLK